MKRQFLKLHVKCEGDIKQSFKERDNKLKSAEYEEDVCSHTIASAKFKEKAVLIKYESMHRCLHRWR